ncbi:MAG: ferric reductase-like transmembrane domain-containing protein [Thermovirgaceae bacterium]
MNTRRYRLFLGFVSTLPLAVTAYLFFLIPPGSWLYAIVRGAGILGYFSSFFAIMASAFTRKLNKIIGKPFLPVHHLFAVAALSLMVIHASAYSLYMKDPGVFIPETDSLQGFLAFGGRAAIYLFILTAATARFSRSIPWWKAIHTLNYIAFFLVSAHAIMIGVDFEHLPMNVLAWTMSTLVLGTLIFRRKGFPFLKKRD